MNQKAYNILKAIALIWLPALGTLVFALTDIWNLSNGAQIVGTIVAVDTFLGAGLGLSARGYNNKTVDFDGKLVVDQTHPLKDTYSLELGDNLGKIPDQKEVRLQVAKAPDIHDSL